MKKFPKALMPGGMILLLFSGPAFADLIDFLTGIFQADEPGGDTSYSATIGSLTLAFTPHGTGTPTLFWNSVDGFGVQGGGYEDDEIEGPEALQISLSDPIYVNYFSLTDFFMREVTRKEGDGRWIIPLGTLSARQVILNCHRPHQTGNMYWG